MLTCTGVSFAHGSNDGQKGVGLIMLILIGLVPAAIRREQGAVAAGISRRLRGRREIQLVLKEPEVRQQLANTRPAPEPVALALAEDAPKDSVTDLPKQYGLTDPDVSSVQELLGALHSDLEGKETPAALDAKTTWDVRTKILLIDQGLGKLHNPPHQGEGRHSEGATLHPAGRHRVCAALGHRRRWPWRWASAPWSAGSASW